MTRLVACGRPPRPGPQGTPAQPQRATAVTCPALPGVSSRHRVIYVTQFKRTLTIASAYLRSRRRLCQTVCVASGGYRKRGCIMGRPGTPPGNMAPIGIMPPGSSIPAHTSRVSEGRESAAATGDRGPTRGGAGVTASNRLSDRRTSMCPRDPL